MKTLCGLLLVTALAVTGCQKGKSGGVAVIDLDRVASAMGWLDELNKNLQAADQDLRNQLNQVLQANLKTIEDAKAVVAKDAKLTEEQIKTLNSIQDPRDLEKLPLSKEQQQKLTQTVAGANQAWQQALNGYQQALQQRRAALVLSYREKVRPSVRRVSAARGATVVFTTSDNLLFVDPNTSDITDAVIDDLQRNPPPKTEVPATPAK